MRVYAAQEKAAGRGELRAVEEEVRQASGNGVGVGVAEGAGAVVAGLATEDAGADQGANKGGAGGALDGRFEDGVGEAERNVAPVAGIRREELGEGPIV